MLKGSPGPIPGPPKKSPMVSVTKPLDPTDPPPVARLIRLKTLNISARSWSLKRSLIGIFFMTETSTSAKPGPENLFRDRSPLGSSGRQVGDGTQNAAGLTHCSPVAGLKECDTSAKGLPIRFKPER